MEGTGSTMTKKWHDRELKDLEKSVGSTGTLDELGKRRFRKVLDRIEEQVKDLGLGEVSSFPTGDLEYADALGKIRSMSREQKDSFMEAILAKASGEDCDEN